jgi:hypothetical protein
MKNAARKPRGLRRGADSRSYQAKWAKVKPLKANILSVNVVETQPRGTLHPSVPTATYDKAPNGAP